MPNKHDKNNLFLYIGISVILHLLILYFLPIGFLQGNARSEGELHDYGYVQLVDYQPSPVQVNEPEPEAEVTEPVEEIDETEEEEEIEETAEEPEEIEEEQIEEDVEEEIPAQEETEIAEELTEEPQENIEEEIEEVVENTEEIIEEAEEPVEDVQETNEENIDDGAQEEENVMSSEESESEIEVVQEQQNTEESTDAEQEENQVSSEQSSEQSSEEAVQEEEETPPPPPPPTSGDLINLVVTPAFPKDLVGTRSEGQVRLIAEISRQGNVNNITIQESSGFESMDRVAVITLERGWTFKEYQQPYRIPVLVNYYFDESDNTQVDVELGEVEFISGGE
jgi:protein TonB